MKENNENIDLSATGQSKGQFQSELPKKTKKKSDFSLLKIIKKNLGGLETFKGLFAGEEKGFFVENFSMLLASGMDVITALEAIKKEVRSPKMKKLIDDVKNDIDAGSPIWKSFKEMKIFPEYVISLVRVGEESGKLSENLKVVADQMQKDRMFRSKVQSAMLYPAIVMGLTVVIGVGVAWFILPKLSRVFEQLDVKLPLITKILISLGEFISKYGIVVVPIGIVSIALIGYVLFSFKKTKHLGDELLSRFPGIKKLVKEVQISRLGFVLGNLLEAGLPVIRALESLADATTSRKYKKFYLYLRDSVEEGISFQRSFEEYDSINKIVPSSIQQMIIASEQSGRLPSTFIKIGIDFEAKTDITAKNLVVVLEPIMLVVVWLGVVAVALAVILPIYSLIGGFNTRGSGAATSTPVTVEIVEETEDQGEVVEPETDVEEQEETEKPIPEEKEKEEVLLPKLEISETGAGYLNVREQPTTSSNIITRVTPGDQYEYTDFVSGWYKIVLKDGGKGWVTGQYVKLL